jgi:HlyD family secretion protein
MTSKSSIAASLAAAAIIAVGGAYAITQYVGTQPAQQPVAVTVARQTQWTATAPGRVEPRGGEIRISAPSAGRVVEIPVRVNDRVRAGDLLLRIEDDELRIRLAAADAELAVRRRDRDAETVQRLAQDRRQAEDAVSTAERALLNQRAELDRLAMLLRAGRQGVTEEAVASQRTAVQAAVEKADQEREALRRAQAATGVPVQTRLEAAVTAARAEVSLLETALERARIRAPADGTVLQLLTRVGETAAASPEQALVVLGDVSSLQVRAELEDRDLAKVRAGQAVTVRSDAFPGVDFAGRVARLAQAVAPARIAQRGPRRPNEQDTLEVMVDLDPGTTLLPGMRVDVFFRVENTAQSGTQGGATAPGAR